MNDTGITKPDPHPDRPARRRARAKLVAIAALFALPVIASYLAYYGFGVQGRVNYGALVDPQRPVAGLVVHDRDGAATSLATLAGRWVMVAVDDGSCQRACVERLTLMRQLRTATGKDRERVERVLLVTGAALPPPEALEPFSGTVVLRAPAADVTALFAAPSAPTDHVFVVDPLGNLMMRFPPAPDGTKMRKDLERLLKISRIG